MTNQVLYRKAFGDATVLAMLWPWQDGTHTTLENWPGYRESLTDARDSYQKSNPDQSGIYRA